jgi:hypothetical protein
MAEQEGGASWRFFSLVTSLNDLALRGMGKIQDPVSGETRRDMNLARTAIDWLDVIQEKTTGNLSDDESRFLRQVVTMLRMNYVEEVEADKQAPAGAGGDTEESPAEKKPN